MGSGSHLVNGGHDDPYELISYQLSLHLDLINADNECIHYYQHICRLKIISRKIPALAFSCTLITSWS